jgi:hypothetical protein
MSVVGGNRYGWFANQEISDLAIDNSLLYPGTGNFTCTGILAYTTVNGDVNVPNGASCTLDHVTVTHNVNVGDSASLDVQASTIGNDIQAKHPASLIVRLGSTVANNVKADGTNSVPAGYEFNFICNSTIGHDLVVQNSTSIAPWVIGWIDPSACAKSVAIGNNANITGNQASVNFSDNSPANGPDGGAGGVGHDLNVNHNTGDIVANDNVVEHNDVFQDNALRHV